MNYSIKENGTMIEVIETSTGRFVSAYPASQKFTATEIVRVLNLETRKEG